MGLAETGMLSEDGVRDFFVQILCKPIQYRIETTQLKPIRGNTLTGISSQDTRDLIHDD